jgi:hypothetical protein
VFTNVDFQDDREESRVKCELRGKDLKGSIYKSVEIDGMTKHWAVANGIKSGATTLFAKDAVIDETNSKLVIPANGAIQVRMYQCNSSEF